VICIDLEGRFGGQFWLHLADDLPGSVVDLLQHVAVRHERLLHSVVFGESLPGHLLDLLDPEDLLPSASLSFAMSVTFVGCYLG